MNGEAFDRRMSEIRERYIQRATDRATKAVRQAQIRAWDQGYVAGVDSEVHNDTPENPYRAI